MATMEQGGSRLATIDPDGQAPKSVIIDAKSAHAVKRQLISADIGRARQRAILKQQFDGHPPFDPAELKKRGLQDMTNVNFKRAASLINTNVDSYQDAQFEVPEMASVVIEYGDGDQGYDFSQTVTDEFNNTLKRWKRKCGYSTMSKSNFNRLEYGIGPMYFEDDINWCPQPAETGQVLVDKDADTNLDNVDVIAIRRTWRLGQLYRMIEDPVSAESLGWNVQAVRTAIIRAAANDMDETYSIKLWETWNNRIKGNDLYMSYVSPGIDCYDLMTKEYDGSISRRLLTDFDTDEVLYQQDKVAEHFGQVIIPFFLTEQESLWHNIRGYGAQLYNILKVLDKVGGRIIDMTFIGASLVIKPNSESTRDKLNTLNLGPVTVLPAGVDYVQTSFPNLSQGPIITHNMLLQTLQQTSGEYQAGSQSTQTGEAPTARQNQNDLETLARLSSSLMNHFFGNVDKLYAEMFRRLSDPNQPDKSTPRGKSWWSKEARRFQQRCLNRGVPRGALREPYLQSVESCTAMGDGSASSRKQSASLLLSLLPLMENPQARIMATKDSFVALFNQRVANRYFPAVPGKLLVSTAKLAELENIDLQQGFPISVMDYEDAVTHLSIHMPMLLALNQQVVQASGGQGQPANMAAIQKIYGTLVVGLPHCSAHLQRIAGDQTQNQNVEAVVNALRKLEATATHLQFQLKTAATAAQRAAIAASQQQTAEASKLQLEAGKLQLANRKQTHKEQYDGIKLAIDLKKAAQDVNVTNLQSALSINEAVQQNQQSLQQSAEAETGQPQPATPTQ